MGQFHVTSIYTIKGNLKDSTPRKVSVTALVCKGEEWDVWYLAKNQNYGVNESHMYTTHATFLTIQDFVKKNCVMRKK